MLRFAVARGGQALLTLWLAATGLFVAVTVLPGDPVRALFGFQAVPPDTYREIRTAYRLDRPLVEQYVLFLADLARGDLGTSFPRTVRGAFVQGAVPVRDVLAGAVPVSARLVLAALVVQLLVGVLAGAAAARRVRVGAAVQAAAVLAVAAPVVVVAFVLRTVVGSELGWLPVRGAAVGAAGYVLPVLSLAALSTGYVALLARAEVGVALRAPWLHAARARGVRERRLLLVHALRPALPPVVAFVAVNLGPSLLGLIAVEAVFDLPGLGGTLVSAVKARDRGLVVGLVAFVMAVVVVAAAVADVVVAWLDPRRRTGGA